MCCVVQEGTPIRKGWPTTDWVEHMKKAGMLTQDSNVIGTILSAASTMETTRVWGRPARLWLILMKGEIRLVTVTAYQV